jgi:hypothetical protein
MSKIPPQLRESVPSLPESATAFAFRHFLWALSPRVLENSLAGCQHFVERFLKISRALSKRLAYLRNILFKALFYLLSKELLESTVAKTLSVFGRMVRDDVRDQRAREALRPLVRILGEEWIYGASRADSG